MRIGYFVTKFPYTPSAKGYSLGGSSWVAFFLALEMAKRGHEVYIFTTSNDNKDSVERNGNITVFRYGTNFKMLTSNISIGLLRKAQRHNVDIVHTHFDIPPTPLFGMRYAKRKELPFVLTYHGDWDAGYGSLARRLGVSVNNKLLTNRVLFSADKIISPSKTYIDKSIYLNKYKKKISVIPNGIDYKKFGLKLSKDECRQIVDFPVDSKVILYLGNLSPYKNPGILLNVFPKIIEEEKDAILAFAGEGSLKEELMKKTRSLGLDKNVRFLGHVDEDLKALCYKAADVFCLPSTRTTECYPLAILEAMASGTPVVASNIGGIPDIIKDGRNGLLVSPNNESELIESILALIDYEGPAKDMVLKASETIKSNSWDRIAEMTDVVYMNLLPH